MQSAEPPRLPQAELYVPEALKQVQGLRKRLFLSSGILGWFGSCVVSRILNTNGYSLRQTRVELYGPTSSGFTLI